MEDKTIVCVDCQQPFVFTAGEQQFYAERGLLELPKRCKPCRGQRRRRLSRRRKSGADRIEAPVDSPVEQAGEDVSAQVEAHPSGNGVKPAVPSGPRTFWDERPEWVRQAMMKAVTPTVPAESGNGSRPGHALAGAAEPEPDAVAGEEVDVAPGGAEQRPEETRRRRRRRSRRRRRRVGDDAMASAAAGSDAPSDPAVEG